MILKIPQTYNLLFSKPIHVDIFYIDRRKQTLYFQWDFGMNGEISINNNYWGKTKKSLKEKVIEHCSF